jgi:hypothetical protein
LSVDNMVRLKLGVGAGSEPERRALFVEFAAAFGFDEAGEILAEIDAAT